MKNATRQVNCSQRLSGNMKTIIKCDVFHFLIQGKLVPKLTIGTFLTPSVRNVQNLQSYLFQAYISLNPSRTKQNFHFLISIYILENLIAIKKTL